MNKLVPSIAAILLIASATAASAQKSHRKATHGHSMSTGSSMTTGSATRGTGGNAAMSGNNGNSAQGSNAAPNIRGGDSGVGR